ncbi:MAG: hypothetical protein K0R49_627 [Burkholderiales bacterium]|nr:hypothetical protein [Burkholderiales bacterium]
MKTNKRSKLKRSLGCVLLASVINVYANTVPKPGNPIIKATGIVKSNNTCLAKLLENELNNTCTNEDKSKCYDLNNAEAQIISTRIETNDDRAKVFGINGIANLSLNNLSGSLKGIFNDKESTKKNELTLYFYSRIGWTLSLKGSILNSTGDTDILERYRDSVEDIKKGKTAFADSRFFADCGDSYVGSVDASFIVVSRIEIEAKSEEALKKISGDLTAAYKIADSNTDNKENDEVALTLKILSKNENRNNVSKISMYFDQLGGDPAALASVLNNVNGNNNIPGELLAAQKCSMSTESGVQECLNVQKAVMDYVGKQVDAKGKPKTNGQLYTNGKLDYSKLYYTNPKAISYSGILYNYDIDDKTKTIMQQIVYAEQALENELFQIEVFKSDYKWAEISSTIITKLDVLKNTILNEIAKINPGISNSQYATCFVGKPSLEACKSSLDAMIFTLEKRVLGNQNFIDYEKLAPKLIYKVSGIPMITRVSANKPSEIRYVTCDAFKQSSALTSYTYKLNCAGFPSLGGDSGNLQSTITIKNNKLVNFGTYDSCRTEADPQNAATGGIRVACEKINLELVNNKKAQGPYTIDKEHTTYGRDEQLITDKSKHIIEIEPAYDASNALKNELDELKEVKASVAAPNKL